MPITKTAICMQEIIINAVFFYIITKCKSGTNNNAYHDYRLWCKKMVIMATEATSRFFVKY